VPPRFFFLFLRAHSILVCRTLLESTQLFTVIVRTLRRFFLLQWAQMTKLFPRALPLRQVSLTLVDGRKSMNFSPPPSARHLSITYRQRRVISIGNKAYRVDRRLTVSELLLWKSGSSLSLLGLSQLFPSGGPAKEISSPRLSRRKVVISFSLFSTASKDFPFGHSFIVKILDSGGETGTSSLRAHGLSQSRSDGYSLSPYFLFF